MQFIKDKYFTLRVLTKTQLPQSIVYDGLHQCYSPFLIHDEETPTEIKCGEIAVKRLLQGDFHGSPLEHASIVFNFGYFPHSAIAQLTRHRHISFSIQSMRYTGEYLSSVSRDNVERFFYLRPIGFYNDRHGAKYEYTEDQRNKDIEVILLVVNHYNRAVAGGMPCEQARGILPMDIRQHGIMSMNIRSLMHLLDMRYKSNAQYEIQTLAQMICNHFREWTPEIAAWYEKSRLGKAKLAP